MGKQMSVKERLFARYVAEGRTQAESVRMAGFASSNPDKKGSELVKKQQVVDLINQRGSELTDERAVSLREHLDTLAALRDDARKAGQYSSAIQAEHHRGKASRLTNARIMRMGVPRVARLHASAHPHPPVCGAGVPHIHIYTNIDSGLPNFTNTTYKNKTIIYNYTP